MKLSFAIGAILVASTSCSATPRWPKSMCEQTKRDHFTTTTVVGGSANFFWTEPDLVTHPQLSREQAYEKYLKSEYPTKEKAPQLQVRFGLINDAFGGEGSSSVLQYVPTVRRTPGWLISICNSPAVDAGPDLTNPDGGVLLVVIPDERPSDLFDHYVVEGGGSSYNGYLGTPGAGETPFVSVPWTIAERPQDKHRLLIRYQTKQCYTLDHINIDQLDTHGKVKITVILSTGPGKLCPAPSAIAPYAEVESDDPIMATESGPLGVVCHTPHYSPGTLGPSTGQRSSANMRATPKPQSTPSKSALSPIRSLPPYNPTGC